MQWKKKLKRLEQEKKWDEAIVLMEDVIKNEPKNLDAYLLMLYLLMNLLVEEDHDESKHDYYEFLAKKYFDTSYELFLDNPKYLFFAGKTALMSEWYFGLEYEEAEALYNKAMQLEPDNLLYQWAYYINLETTNTTSKAAVTKYAQSVLNNKGAIRSQLKELGALGEYVEELLVGWSIDQVASK